MLKQYFSTSLGCRKLPGLNHSPTSRRMWKTRVGPLLHRVMPHRGTGTIHRDQACTNQSPLSWCSASPELCYSSPTLHSSNWKLWWKYLFSVSSFCFPHLPSQGQGDSRVVNSSCSDLRAWWGRDTTENITLQKVKMGTWEMATALEQSSSTGQHRKCGDWGCLCSQHCSTLRMQKKTVQHPKVMWAQQPRWHRKTFNHPK